MDFLGYFIFRTGMPFGYIAFAVSQLVIVGLGLKLLWQGLRARPVNLLRSAGGGAMLAMVVFVVGANIVFEESLDLSPFFTAEDIPGDWRDGKSRLLLRANGSYSCDGGNSCDTTGASGYWRSNGSFDLLFTSENGRSRQMRVVRYRGHLRLTEGVDDPDLWAGRLLFEQRGSTVH